MAELDPTTMTWTAMGSSGKSRLECRRGLDPDARRHHPDRGCAEQSELRALHSFAAGMGIGWQHDRSTCKDLRKWAAFRTAVDNIVLREKPALAFCVPMAPYSQPARPIRALLLVIPRSIIPAPAPTDPGTWTPGPDFSQRRRCRRQLRRAADQRQGAGGRQFRRDCTSSTEPTSLPRSAAIGGSLMVLPTGRCWSADRRSTPPRAAAMPIWAPFVLYCPATVTRGQTYTVFGRQFNGIVASCWLWRRVRDGHQLPAGAHHQQRYRTRLLRQDARPQPMGVQTKSLPVYTTSTCRPAWRPARASWWS